MHIKRAVTPVEKVTKNSLEYIYDFHSEMIMMKHIN